MDQSIKAILGITPPKQNPMRQLIPARTGQDKASINAAYKSMALPQISNSDNPVVLKFHQDATKIIQDECRNAVEALAKIDPNYSGPVKLAKAAGLARLSIAAVTSRLQNAAVPLARIVYDARAIVDAAMDRCPKDANGAILWRLKVEGLRRQLDDMSPEDQAAAATTMAKQGNEVFPEVFLNSIRKYLPDSLITTLTNTYQGAFAGDAMQTLEDAQDALIEAKAIIGSAELAISVVFTNAGVPTNWKQVTVGEIVKAWPKAAKASCIAANGEEAYTDLLQGRLGLETALGMFRPGLAEEN